MAKRPGEPAPDERGDDRTQRGGDREQVAERRLDRDRDRAEDDRQQDQREADDDHAEGHQRAAELAVDVDGDGGLAGDRDVGDLELLLQRRGLGPDALHQVGGPRIALGPLGHDPDQPEVAGRVRGLLGDGQDARELGDVVGQICDRALRIRAGDDVGGDQQRRVVAGAELGGDQVVGGPLGRADLGAAVVGQGQGEVLDRDGQTPMAGQDDERRSRPAAWSPRRPSGRPWSSPSAALLARA